MTADNKVSNWSSKAENNGHNFEIVHGDSTVGSPIVVRSS